MRTYLFFFWKIWFSQFNLKIWFQQQHFRQKLLPFETRCFLSLFPWKPVHCTQLASLAVWKPVVMHFFASFLGKAPVKLKTCAIPRLKIAAFESVLDHFAVNTFPRYGEWSIQVAVFNLLRLWSQTSCEGFWGQRIYNESIAKIRRKFWPQRFVSIASKTFLRSKETYPMKGDWTAVEQSRHTRF